MKVTKFTLEAMLLKWTESSSGGATVVLQLADADDLAIFKTMTLAKRGVAGQRLEVTIAEIGDDEKPVAHEVKNVAAGSVAPAGPTIAQTIEDVARKVTKAHYPGGFCGLAVKWCDDEQFRHWIAAEYKSLWEATADVVNLTHKNADAERVAAMIKGICGVNTRKDLDSNEEAHDKFDERVRQPYMAFIKEGGLV